MDLLELSGVVFALLIIVFALTFLRKAQPMFAYAIAAVWCINLLSPSPYKEVFGLVGLLLVGASSHYTLEYLRKKKTK